MWNVEKWSKWAYLQNRLTDIENKLMVTEGGRERGVNLEFRMKTLTLPYIKHHEKHPENNNEQATLSIYNLVVFNSEKAMAPHSSILAWKIPWMEEPGRLRSMGSLRVRHDWATSLSLFTFMHWRRKWQPTPVFLPGESQGRGSLVGCCLWGRTESDTTEVT